MTKSLSSMNSITHYDENICPQTLSVLRAKFKENRGLWGADNAKDIYPCIFLIAFIILQIFDATLMFFYKLRNITQILSSFISGIFSQVIRLDQLFLTAPFTVLMSVGWIWDWKFQVCSKRKRASLKEAETIQSSNDLIGQCYIKVTY